MPSTPARSHPPERHFETRGCLKRPPISTYGAPIKHNPFNQKRARSPECHFLPRKHDLKFGDGQALQGEGLGASFRTKVFTNFQYLDWQRRPHPPGTPAAPDSPRNALEAPGSPYGPEQAPRSCRKPHQRPNNPHGPGGFSSPQTAPRKPQEASAATKID